jgi:uncharacterized protein YhjY with autotransporter beta-barrel domain
MLASGFALPASAQAPAQLTIVSGNNQKGLPGSTLAQPLTVRLTSGPTVVNGAPIRFIIVQDTTGGATISPETTTTNPLGLASTILTLGPSPGAVRVCANPFIAPLVCFDAEARWPELEIVSGDGQSLTPFTTSAPLVVGLDDDAPSPSSTISVLWTIVSGNATFPGGTVSLVTALAPFGTASTQVVAGAGPSAVRVRAALPAFPQVVPVEFRLEVQAPAVPSLIVVSGNRQATTVGSPFSAPLVVRALDGSAPAVGLPVTWSVLSGAVQLDPGGVNATSTTDSAGLAQINLLAGAAPGPARIRASAPGFEAAEFDVVVIAADERLEILSGDGQAGTPGTVSQPLVVRVTRAASGGTIGIPGRRIDWALEAGSATLALNTSLTDAEGVAQIRFVFGSPGPIAIRGQLAGSSQSVLFRAQSLGPRLLLVSGDGQVGRTGEPLAQPLVVRLVGESPGANLPIAGATVSWRILQGGGTLASAATVTSADGSSENRLTLPPDPGPVLVEASSPGAGSVLFRAEARAFLPADIRLEILSGNAQTLVPNTPSQPLVVRATDLRGRPLADIGLSWTVRPEGSGRLEAATTRTGADGRSQNVFRLLEPRSVMVRVEVVDPAGANASVDFSFTGGLAETPGLDPVERERARGLDQACSAVAELPAPNAREAELRQICQRLSEDAGAEPSRLRLALRAIDGRELLAGSRLGLEAAAAQFENLRTRLLALRSGVRGLSVGGLRVVDGANVLPLSLLERILLPATETPGTEDFSRWGVFVTGMLGRGRRAPGDRESGFRFDQWSLTAGVDYRLRDRLVLGSALGYNATDTRVGDRTGRVDAESRSLALYAAWNGESSYLDAVLTRATSRLDNRRDLALAIGQGANPLRIEQVFASKADGRQTGLTLSAGHEFVRGALSAGPYLRASWVRQRIDGYAERALFADRPGAALAIRADPQRIESRQLSVGARAQYVLSTSWGVLVPTGQVEYVREYEDEELGLIVRLVHDPTASPIVVRGDRLDRSFAHLGLGVSAVLSGGRSGYLFYERTLGLERQRREELSIGLRFEF